MNNFNIVSILALSCFNLANGNKRSLMKDDLFIIKKKIILINVLKHNHYIVTQLLHIS